MLDELIQIIKLNAQAILLPAFGKVQASVKSDGSLVTAADLNMSTKLQNDLQKQWPDIQFLSEEMSKDEQEALFKTKNLLWILDPLDGTTNFANGIPVFAVSLALIEAGQLKLGIVYDPVRDECFTVQAGGRAQLNGRDITRPTVPDMLQGTVGIIDFKRLPEVLRVRIVKDVPYTSQRSFGSGALDWCWLAIGRGHVYLHGRQNVWDYIVGQSILSQAHGKCCDLQGKQVFDGSLTPRSVVAAATPELFAQWCSWLNIDL